MCRLHDDTPSLMRVWFLELWEGCVAQYAVYAHRATGAISQGDTGIEFRNVEVWGLGVGPWVIVIRGTYDNSPLCSWIYGYSCVWL